MIWPLILLVLLALYQTQSVFFFQKGEVCQKGFCLTDAVPSVGLDKISPKRISSTALKPDTAKKLAALHDKGRNDVRTVPWDCRKLPVVNTKQRRLNATNTTGLGRDDLQEPNTEWKQDHVRVNNAQKRLVREWRSRKESRKKERSSALKPDTAEKLAAPHGKGRNDARTVPGAWHKPAVDTRKSNESGLDKHDSQEPNTERNQEHAHVNNDQKRLVRERRGRKSNRKKERSSALKPDTAEKLAAPHGKRRNGTRTGTGARHKPVVSGLDKHDSQERNTEWQQEHEFVREQRRTRKENRKQKRSSGEDDILNKFTANRCALLIVLAFTAYAFHKVGRGSVGQQTLAIRKMKRGRTRRWRKAGNKRRDNLTVPLQRLREINMARCI